MQLSKVCSLFMVHGKSTIKMPKKVVNLRYNTIYEL